MRSLPVKILFLITLGFCFPFIWTQGIVGNYGDIYQYAAPFRTLSKNSLQSGSIPLWNPYIFAGTPFLASPQSALFYPGSLFFYFFPMNYAFNFFSILHLYLNGLGMLLLLRALGRSQSAALFGSAAWAFSFFFLSKCAAGHVIHLSGYSFFPYVLLFAIRSAQAHGRFPYLSFFCLLMSSTLQFFSGHVQVWFHTHLLLALILCWKCVANSPSEKRFYCKIALTFLISFSCLSLIQSLPTFVYMLHSSRFNPTEIVSRQSAFDFATSYSMNWNNLIALFLPNFFGTPMKNNYSDPDHPSVFFETSALYWGMFPLLLSLAGLCLALKKKRFFLPTLSLLFLLLAMGKNSFIYDWVWQGLIFLRVPARFYFLTFTGMVFAATFFWDHSLKRRKAIIKMTIFACTLADLFLNGKQFIWSEDYLQKMGKTPTLEWLQIQTYQDLGDPRVSKRLAHLSPRIFSTAELGNPNKSMLVRLQNVNGYEAILQKSLLNYFAMTQGNSRISTTGVDLQHPMKNSFSLLGVKYLVTTYPLNLNWPALYEDPPLKIYENPDVFNLAQPLFSLRKSSEFREIFSILDSQAFNFKKQIIQYVPPFEKSAQSPLDHKEESALEENLQEKEVRLLSYRRMNSNRIDIKWKGSAPADFWIFLSESFYPGWECWSESGARMTPFLANGYFQGIRFAQIKTPEEKIFCLFRPKDFAIGALVTAFSIILLMTVPLLSLST